VEGERRAAREATEGEGGKAEGAAGEVPEGAGSKAGAAGEATEGARGKAGAVGEATEGEARYFQMEIVGGCRVMSYEHNGAVS